jgi:enoyl-CoA hydratase/carnithine racemase
MVALTRAIGRKRALQMLLTGELVAARTAADWGLINQVVPAADLQPPHGNWRRRWRRPVRWWWRIGKQAFYTQIDLDQPKPTPTPRK